MISIFDRREESIDFTDHRSSLHTQYILFTLTVVTGAGGQHPGRQKNQESVDSTRVRDTVIPGALEERFQGDRAPLDSSLRVTIT